MCAVTLVTSIIGTHSHLCVISQSSLFGETCGKVQRKWCDMGSKKMLEELGWLQVVLYFVCVLCYCFKLSFKGTLLSKIQYSAACTTSTGSDSPCLQAFKDSSSTRQGGPPATTCS
uniref:Uncharacterized protein n=1 Tax=Ficedula albicollis TaxID=59894 RepID=A0A803VJ20_FICAL